MPMEPNNINRMHASIEAFDLATLIRYIMMQIKLIAAVTFISFFASYYNYQTAEKTYLANTLLQKLNTPSPAANDIFLGQSNPTDIDSVKELYLSRTNILGLIERLKINLGSSNDNFDLKNINKLSINNKEIESAKFRIFFQEQNFLLEKDDISLGQFEYDVDYEVGSVEINFSKPSTLANEEYEISYINPEMLYQPVRSGFQLQAVGSQNIFYGGANILKVSYMSTKPQQAIDVLNEANDLFLNANIFTETEQAQKAIQFINERLNIAQERLNLDKNNLTQFRSINNTLNVEQEISSIIETIEALEVSIYDLNVEITEARKTFTDSNPILENLIERKALLELRKNEIELQIKDLPLEQQEYIDLFRKLETTSNIVKELEAKKLEYSIKEASTLGNIRIVDEGYIVGIVAPKSSNVLFTTALGFLFILVLALIRGMFFIPIFNPAQIKENLPNSNLVGVLPFENDDDNAESSKSAAESLLVNIDFLLEQKNISSKCKVIALTSATAQNGKSFSSRLIAEAYAKQNKKVLLIDADFKRGDQHKEYNLPKITLDEFRGISSENIEALKAGDIYLLPKLTKLISSFEFLYSTEFSAKIENFKQIFDLIIIDTAPLLSVSDTSIILGISDANLLIARHDKTKASELIQVNLVANQLGQDFDGVIYNAYQKPRGYYGYEYYGNYNYQYYAKKYLYENYDYDRKV